MFGIGKAVGEDTGATNDSPSEVDNVGGKWCRGFCNIVTSLTVAIFSSVEDL